MKKRVSVVWMFFLAAALFLLAGVIPLFRDRPVDAAFLAIAALWFILGLSTMKENARVVKSGDEEP